MRKTEYLKFLKDIFQVYYAIKSAETCHLDLNPEICNSFNMYWVLNRPTKPHSSKLSFYRKSLSFQFTIDLCLTYLRCLSHRSII